MKLLVALSIFLLTSIQTALADQMSPFEGSWVIDVDKTMENIKNSPGYDKSEDEHFKETMTNMMKAMRLNIETDKVIYSIGQRQEVISLGKKTASPSAVVAEINGLAEKATLTFTAIDKEHLNLKSSTSNDMDYIIWEKANQGANQPTELDVISDAIKESVTRDQ